MLEGEPAVSGHVVGVRVRLERTDDAGVAPLGLPEVGLDRVPGVDHHRFAGVFVADQVGRAAEIVVDELAKKHQIAS